MRYLALVFMAIGLLGCNEDTGNAQNHCPSCDTKGCPVCEKCKACPNDGHDSISTQISGLTKSGERLKVYYYKGDDGSQLPMPYTPKVFDTRLEVDCTPQSFEAYGCNGQTYCVPDTNTHVFIYPEDYEDSIQSYCAKMYDSSQYDDSLITFFTKKNTVKNADIRQSNSYFSDDRCSIPYEGVYVFDQTCLYNSQTLFEQIRYVMKEKPATCINNTVSMVSYTEPIYTTYKPANTNFKPLYGGNYENCIEATAYPAILLQITQQETKEQRIARIRSDRERICKPFCDNLKQTAIIEDWAVLHKSLME